MHDDNAPRKKPTHDIGQDLSLLSVGELRERVETLRAEIARLEETISAKQVSKSAAEGVFRR